MQAQTFSSGDGSQANPYLITSDADLQQLAADVNGGITYSGVYFKLTTDIDLSGINWIPIGTIDYSFNGKFDGCGYKISNISVDIDINGAGLFGVAGNGSEFSNIIIASGTIKTSAQYAGGIVGCSMSANTGTISFDRCANYATVYSTNSTESLNAGGIYGCNKTNKLIVTMTNCYNAGLIGDAARNDKRQENGGLSGWVGQNTLVSNCYNIGNVYGTDDYNSVLVRYYNTATISGAYYLKTLAGNFDRGDFIAADSNAFASGEVAYMLGEAYGQNIGTDTIPVFYNADNQVFKVSVMENGVLCDALYSNATLFTLPAAKSYYQWSGCTAGDVFNITQDTTLQCTLLPLNITCATVANGSFSVDKTTARFGDTVTINVIPDAGYVLRQFNVTTSAGDAVTVAADSTFIMPKNDVVVSGYIGRILATEVGADGLTYYLIYDSYNLDEFRLLVNDGNTTINGKVKADIDLSGISWIPIGTIDYSFDGKFDGGGYKISNISVDIDINGAGLFGIAGKGAEFSNIIIASGTIKTSAQYAGGIVGYSMSTNTGTISFDRCANYAAVYSTNSSAASLNAGGIYGCHKTNKLIVTMTNCYNAGLIGNAARNDKRQENGGLSGWIWQNALVSNCYNIGNVYGTDDYNSVLVRYSSNTNTVFGAYYLNTLAGNFNRSDFIAADSDAFASGEVAYLLGEAYGQNIGTDTVPVFRDTDNQVFKVRVMANGVLWDSLYSNATLTIPAAKSYYQWINFTEGDVFTITQDTTLQCVLLPFNITCATVANGSFSVDKTTACVGDIVTINVIPDAGYVLRQFNVTTSAGDAVTVAADSTFVMPKNDVVVSGYIGRILTTEVGADGLTYYLIYDSYDLDEFRRIVNVGCTTINGKVKADIDLSGINWTPIGTINYPFSGKFDGGGYKISNISVDIDIKGAGLFGLAESGAKFSNIIIASGTVKTSDQYAGGIVGYNMSSVNAGTISFDRCANYATVYSTDSTESLNAGGIYGCNKFNVLTIIMTNCYNAGLIGDAARNDERQENGGLSGWVGQNTLVSNCYNIGNVYGTADYNSVLVRYYNTATIFNDYYLNTLAGNVNHSNFIAADSDAFASGKVAYLLGEAYGQNIGTDNVPVFRDTDNQVFKVSVMENGVLCDALYSNKTLTIPAAKLYYQWIDCTEGDVFTITQDTTLQCKLLTTVTLSADEIAYCEGGSTTFTATVTNTDSIFWYADGAELTAERGKTSMTVSPTATTTYKVIVKNTDTTYYKSAVAKTSQITVGDIVTTDSLLVKPADWTKLAAAGKTALGVVYHVSDTLTRIVMLSENADVPWGFYGTDILGVPNYTSGEAANDYSGATHTGSIIAYNNRQSTPLTASQCAAVWAAWQGGYLPAAGEMKTMKNNRDTINLTLSTIIGGTQISDKWSWSSSEYSDGTAWGVYGSGYVSNGYKTNVSRARAVLALSTIYQYDISTISFEAEAEQTVYVAAMPTASLFADTTVYCEGGSTVFTATITNADSIYWYADDT